MQTADYCLVGKPRWTENDLTGSHTKINLVGTPRWIKCEYFISIQGKHEVRMC